jgi:hypothetical protein
LDQTVRNAIGIPFVFDADKTRVGLVHVRRSLRQRLGESATILLRRRYVALRAHKVDVLDMEKNVVRVEKSVLDILGIKSGSRVIIEAWDLQSDDPQIKQVSLRALELEEGFLEKRQEREEPSQEARYPKASELLGIDPDIRGIYIDSHERRDILGIGSIDPVRIRGNINDLVAREFAESGLLFFVSLFALTQVLTGGLLTLTWWTFTSIAVGSFVISFLLGVIKLRSL